MNTREYNFDLLRVVSCIAVILIHVSKDWFNEACYAVSTGSTISELNHPIGISVLVTVPRFAVPCFIMLSGAFILNKKSTRNYKMFYSNIFKRIGIPTVIFSIAYVLYRVPFCFIGESTALSEIKSLVIDIFKGCPMYHMWYLYMIIGIYALAPLLVRFKETVSDKTFNSIAFGFLILANLSQWTTNNVYFTWDLGNSFEYLGYFMVGYCIRNNVVKKSSGKAVSAIALGIIIELTGAYFQYGVICRGIQENKMIIPSSPIIVMSSLLIFYGFANFNFNKNISRLSFLTFYIYLIHAGVWDFIKKVTRLLKGDQYLMKIDAIGGTILFGGLVFVISYILAVIYKLIVEKIDSRYSITNALSKLVRLN